MQITLGGMDYNTAIRSTIKQLSAEGVGAIRYPTGRTDTIEVAVRRAVVTGVNQTALKLQDARADEMGADLVEVSAHAGARPSHAQWRAASIAERKKQEISRFCESHRLWDGRRTGRMELLTQLSTLV